MKKPLWILCLAVSTLLYAQNTTDIQKPITFEKHFGSKSYMDWAESVRQTKDGGYIVAANACSCLDGCYDALIIRLTQNGNILWTKKFGGNEDDVINAVRETPNGDYILAGATLSKSKGDYDGWVIKLDDKGDLLWEKRIGGKEVDFLNAVELRDEGYIAVGYTGSKGKGQNDAWVITLDKEGNTLSDQTFGGDYNDGISNMSRTKDKGYILVGKTLSKGEHDTGPWLLKLDAKGKLLWEKNIDGWADDEIQSVLQTDDGGYLLSGATTAKGAGKEDGWIIRLDKEANILWDKTFGEKEEDMIHELIRTQDGGYLLAGRTKSKGSGEMDAWVLKIDRDGNVLWEKTFGQNGNDGVYSAQETEDGGYILAGTMEGNYSYEAWIIKLDKDGILSN